MYEDLVRALRAAYARPCSDLECPGSGECPTAGCLFREAADAIEELNDKANRAIGFWDSAELAEAMRNINKYLPDISDPEWQRAHMEMGFYSPLGEIYEELGVYDNPPKEAET